VGLEGKYVRKCFGRLETVKFLESMVWYRIERWEKTEGHPIVSSGQVIEPLTSTPNKKI